MDLTIAITGTLVGLMVGVTSTGGGALLTPALVLGLGVPAPIAIGSDVVIAAVMKLAGGGFYVARRAVDWQLVGRLTAGSAPGALLGLTLLHLVELQRLEILLRQALGASLMLVGLATAFHLFTRPRPAATMPTRPGTVLIGFLIGLLVSTTSVGSGSLLLAVLLLWYPRAPATMVGTDLVHALALTSIAGLGHLAAGRVDVALCANVLAGAIPGVVAGASLATHVPQRALRSCLAVVLVAIGLRLAGS